MLRACAQGNPMQECVRIAKTCRNAAFEHTENASITRARGSSFLVILYFFRFCMGLPWAQAQHTKLRVTAKPKPVVPEYPRDAVAEAVLGGEPHVGGLLKPVAQLRFAPPRNDHHDVAVIGQ